MEIFLHADAWIALITLIFLEVVLGIDNIIFISIVSNKLPEHAQGRARNIGLVLALLMRIALLFGITYIIKMKEPLFTIDLFDLHHETSWRDIILFAGGIFLLIKSTSEIHHKVVSIEEGTEEKPKGGAAQVGKIIFQIVLLDIVFSFDSILTAVGLSDEILIMVIAVIVSIIIMLIYSGAIAKFINEHPTLQVLALSFLILIGVMLILDGFHYEIPKGYIYFSVAFSLIVELINMRLRRKPGKD